MVAWVAAKGFSGFWRRIVVDNVRVSVAFLL